MDINQVFRQEFEKRKYTYGQEKPGLWNEQSHVNNTTRYLHTTQEVTTTTIPTEKHNTKTSPGEEGRSDWLPVGDTIETK